MTDHAKEAGVRTVQDLVRVLGPLYGTGFFTQRDHAHLPSSSLISATRSRAYADSGINTMQLSSERVKNLDMYRLVIMSTFNRQAA
jgi:hypothetical protein